MVMKVHFRRKLYLMLNKMNKIFYIFLLFLLPVSVMGQTTQWRLIWDQNPEDDISYYRIFRSTNPDPTTEVGVNNYPDTLYTDTNISVGILYYYRVTAVDTGGLESDYSDNVSAAIPQVADIPNQLVNVGQSFAQITLDNYVNDPDHSDEQISWTYSGNTQLTVVIDTNRVATVSPPDGNWFGSETITFTATDPDSFFNLDSAMFTVDNNQPPVVSNIPDQTVNQGELFAVFDLDTLVADPDDADADLNWTYSGNIDLEVSIDINHLVSITKPFSDWTGSESITFTATDHGGLSDSDAALFTANAPPVLSDIPDQSVNQGQAFVQVALDNYVTDPDNNDNEINWTYSGNSELSVVIDANRVATIAIPSSEWIGSETITFTGTDPGGLSDQDGAIFLVNAPPTVSDIPDQRINQGQEFSVFDLDDFVTDPDHDISELDWTYTGNTELTVSIDANHLVTITMPSADWHGSEQITFTATDPLGASDSDPATFTVNGAPVVSDIPDQLLNEGEVFARIYLDDYVTDPDNADAELSWVHSGANELIVSIDTDRIVTISTPYPEWTGSETILFKTSDPGGLVDSNGAVFSINARPVVSDIPDQVIFENEHFTQIHLDEEVSDIDNSDSEINWTYQGNTELTVSIDANRVATITYPADWSGTETITFTATDPGGLTDSDPAEFTLYAAPVVADIPDQLINEGHSFAQIHLDEYVTDPDNPDNEINWSHAGEMELIVSIDANRIATIALPDPDWTGTETVTFTATDPNGLSDNDPASFSINAHPELSDIPDQLINQGSNFTQIILDDYASDSDNSDAELSWSYSGNSALSVTIDANHVATVSQPQNWSGAESITFTATDPGGANDSDPALFTANGAPVVSTIPAQSINQGENFSQINLNDYVADPDNEDADLNWTYSGNTELQVSIDVNNIAIVTTPSSDWYGTETVTFTATDPGDLSDNTSVTFSVNAAPIVSDIPNQSVYEGTNFSTFDLDNYVTDPYDADAGITWTYSGNTNLTVMIDGGNVVTISYPDGWTGSETVTFTATDAGGLYDSDPANFTVLSHNSPVVSDIADQYKNEGQSFDTIALDDYVTDPDNTDAEQTWTYIGNSSINVNIDSDTRIATISAPDGWVGSETITFTATDPTGLSDNDAVLFTINGAPVVSAIPNQSVNSGSNFSEINLNNYVADPNDADTDITWTYSGNTNIQVSINNEHIALITYPQGWYGQEAITFTANDPGGLTDNTTATFDINAAPEVSNIPDQSINDGQGFLEINLNNYVNDPDDPDNSIQWQTSGNTQLTITIDGDNIAAVSMPGGWTGRETISFTAIDPGGLSDSDPAIFSVNSAPVVTDIPNQSINQGESFATIQLDNYVSDSDNGDAQISWSYSGNSELSISIDANRVARIFTPSADWSGTETILFTATDPGGLTGQNAGVYTVYAEPVVMDIPNQFINQGQLFTQINLNDYVSDQDNADNQIAWAASGNSALAVDINQSNQATVTYPFGWNGSETILFTATDPSGLSDSDQANFSLNSAPVVTDIPDQTSAVGDVFATVSLDEYVSDPDNNDSEISWSFSGNTELQISINTNRVVSIIKPTLDWTGKEIIVFTASDPNELSHSDSAVFYTNGLPVIEGLTNQVHNQGEDFNPIALDDFVSDQNNPDSELSWSANGQNELAVEIDANHIATITKPTENWYGAETIIFTVMDPDGATDTSAVRFKINASPQITSVPTTDVEVGANYSYQVNVTDADDQNSFVFTLIEHPVFLNISEQGFISGVPAVSDTGAHQITVQVNDSSGASDTQTFVLLVKFNPNAPTLSAIPPQAISEGSVFSVIPLNQFAQSDNPEDSLSWSYSGNLDLTIQIDTLNIATIFLPDSNWFGRENITFRVTNKYGLFSEQQVLFTVYGVNDPPQIITIPDQKIYQNEVFDAISLDNYVSDVDNANADLKWSFSGNKNLYVRIDSDRQANIEVISEDWVGSEIITFTVSDNGGLSAQTSVEFIVEQSIFSEFGVQFVGSGTILEIRWQTKISTKGQILFGQSTLDAASEKETRFTKNHSLILSDLEAEATYQFQAQGTDSAGNDYFSLISNFETALTGAINVFPNPYYAGKYPENDVIHFANLPQGSSVSIFNFLGEPVFIKKNLTNLFRWDVRNNHGSQVQAGLYIYMIKDVDNKKLKSGKFVIIR